MFARQALVCLLSVCIFLAFFTGRLLAAEAQEGVTPSSDAASLDEAPPAVAADAVAAASEDVGNGETLAAPETPTSDTAAKSEESTTAETSAPRGGLPKADPSADLEAARKLLRQLGDRVGVSPTTASYMVYVLLAIFTLSFVNKTAANIWHRIELWCFGVVHMFFSTDARFNPKKQPDPNRVVKAMSNDLSCSHPTRRIIFIRHGESCWNEVFNRGFNPGMLVRIVKSIIKETLCVFGTDSLYLDSPLSSRGIEQVQELHMFVADAEQGEKLSPERRRDWEALRGSKPSVLATSNLRRAIATVCIGLWSRLKGSQEKMYVCSSLQEGSRNVDCMCLAKAYEVPPLKRVKKTLENDAFDGPTHFDASWNHGNKAVFGSGLARLKEFAGFCMMEAFEDRTIVVGGHSLWFKKFFQTFLPHDVVHTAKDCKMQNAAAVGFTLTGAVVDGEWLYRIDPKSITEVFGPKNEKKPYLSGQSFIIPKPK